MCRAWAAELEKIVCWAPSITSVTHALHTAKGLQKTQIDNSEAKAFIKNSGITKKFAGKISCSIVYTPTQYRRLFLSAKTHSWFKMSPNIYTNPNFFFIHKAHESVFPYMDINLMNHVMSTVMRLMYIFCNLEGSSWYVKHNISHSTIFGNKHDTNDVGIHTYSSVTEP